ncbi:hypothetical protein [Desulfosarcina sp.]|uniref:hypothetical protein n=1 Tax=Desulfosarcina sp. TaxID=2027861 RepID=UPI0035696D77
MRWVVVVVLFMMTQWALAYEEVEDLVDIFSTDSAFIAVVDGKRNFSEAKTSSETILWQGAKGEIGAFLTNERLLAVSTRSGQWNVIALKANEKKEPPDMLIAAHLLLMLTGERIVAFGTHTGGFFQTRMPIGEPVVAKSAEGRVAAVVTPARAFGFSTFRRGAAEIRFKLKETVVSAKATYTKITLQTSQRLITLKAEDAVWRQFDLK